MKNRSLNFQGTTFAFFVIIWQNGGISISKCLNVLKYLFRSIHMTPFYLSELIFRSKKIKGTEITTPPIFIIGHYRSGSTYLYKLLSCDKRWGRIITADFLFPFYPPWYLRIVKSVFQAIINVSKIENPHFNNYLLDLDEPMAEDMLAIASFSPYSSYWGEVFPKNFKRILDRQILLNNKKDKENWQKTYLYLLKKITLKNDGKRLLLKNPPNTGRVNHLLELYPDAKFIFIHRNPYRVYYSTYNLWKNLLEKTYAVQQINDQEREENIFYNYQLLVGNYLKEKEHIPANNLIEISYDDLKKNPLECIQSIYEKFDLGAFENMKPILDKLLSKEKKYSTYNYIYDDATQDNIYEAWGQYIDHWKYKKLSNE